MIDELLEGNRQFVREEFQINLEYYQSIAREQTPKVLWIGCSDSRTPEQVITRSAPGTIFVHRNIANIVAFNDVNIAAIVEYALVHLHIPDIVICGHYQCGGIKALDKGVDSHYIADWLLIAGGAKEKVDQLAKQQALSPEARHNLLVEENVRLQIKHLQRLSLIQHPYRLEVVPRIHGWVYSVETGEIKVVVDGRSKS